MCYQIHIRQRDGYIGSAFPSPTRFSCKTSNKLVEVLHSCTAIRQRAWGIQQGWILVLGKLVAAATPLPEALVREDGRTHAGTQKGATGCLAAFGTQHLSSSRGENGRLAGRLLRLCYIH